MATRWVTSRIVVVYCVISAYGCGDDTPSEEDEKPRVCEPGTVFDCFRGGCRGRQTCSTDGTALSTCSCLRPSPDDDAGAPSDASQPLDAMAEPDASAPDAEDCANDRDDDGDGDVDCADSDCGERACAAGAPAGFEGPIALRSSVSAQPSCSGTFATPVFEAGESPAAAAASCTTCTCTPSAASCAEFVNFEFGTEPSCGGALHTTSLNGSCVELTPANLSAVSSAQLHTGLPEGAMGSCSPSLQTPSKPAIAWARRVVGCDAADPARGGCERGAWCLPAPETAAGVDVELCVWREGEHACPAERYTDRRVYHRGVDDTRTCSACSCEGPSCTYRWSVFDVADTMCQSEILGLTAAEQCAQVDVVAGAVRVGATLGGDGACAPSGGSSRGDVAGQDPVTVCCVE